MKKKIKLLLFFIILLNYKSISAQTINYHTTMEHTKQEIIEKYNESKSKFNYNNSIYREEPSNQMPYKEGSLKTEVEEDVLGHLNYYRWLQGLNPLTINRERQNYNQKGALIIAVNGVLSHKPSKPSGMDDSFYNDGYSACGSKSNTYQGNLSMGIRIDKAPESFITDDSNVESNVAHRSSMLNPNAKQVSFGFAYNFSTMSIHYNNVNNNSDTYYAWPPAGYFPLESMIQNKDTRWSIWLGNNYTLTNNTTVVLKNNNKEYLINRNSLKFTDYSKNMYYDLPEELRKSITSNNRYQAGETVNVKINNLTKNGVNHTITYDIKFFSVKEKAVESISINKKEISLEVDDEEYLTASIFPNDSTDKTITWETSDNNIVSVDQNGMIKGISVGSAIITAKTNNGKTSNCQVTVTDITPGVSYQTHVENLGWQSTRRNGEMSGTEGQSFRLEGIKIKLKKMNYTGNINYRTHIENLGWETSYKRNGEMSGTSGKSLRLEAIQIKLSGTVSEHYDVYYRVHAENFGWLGWARNGEAAGTSGYGFRLEAIEIKLVDKGETFSEYNKNIAFKNKSNQEIPTVVERNASVSYQTHVENLGWQNYVKDGEMSGTEGRSFRLEGIKIKLEDQDYEGSILYKTHIENLGWENTYKKDDEMSGTSGQALRLEAIEINLDGLISEKYDVYYRVHAENFGWLGWARNGEAAGTEGYAFRLEAIEIKLVKKNEKIVEYKKNDAFKKKNNQSPQSFAKKDTIVTYQTHVENLGWQNYVKNGEMSGTSGRSFRLEGIKIKLEDQNYEGNILYRTHIENLGWEKNYKKENELSGTEGHALRLEAIQIKLTGEMEKQYDVYYRVHAENFGWMSWAKNDEKSGTAGYGFRLEAIEIVLTEKGESPSNNIEINTPERFKEKDK